MIFLGQKFGSIGDLKSAIENYEKEKFIQVYISDCRTIESAKKRGLQKVIKQELHYAEIVYSCICSGKYKSRSKGWRPNQSTYRQGCEFKIRLKVSDDGQFLEVVVCKEEHNHEINEKTFQCLPRQRILDDATRNMASKMLKLRANKKLVQNEIMETCNTKVTLKDLHNLANTRSRNNPLENIFQLLKEKEGSIVEVVKNEENTLLGIFYQDEDMRKTYRAYPEIFFLDAIYKVNDRKMPLYVMLIENGNGESEIVALFLVTTETAVVVTSIASIFKSHNPAWEKNEVILTDKDMIERESFHSEFPNSKMLICLFHALRTFRREITVEKRGITQGERDLCLELIQNMAYAANEDKYLAYYNNLKESAPKSVIDYFDENWHDIRDEWVISLQQKQGRTCGNRTNNRLESTNQKIMQVVKRHSKLDEMFEDLLKLISSLRTERDCTAAAIQLRKPLNVEITESAETEYLKLLTPYAFAKVKEKFNLLKKVNVLETDDEGIKVKATEGTLQVKPEKCTCIYFISMGLPCHHILKCRQVQNMNLYSPNLVAQRWTKSYYLANSRLTGPEVATDTDAVNENIHITTMQSNTRKVLSQHQKFRAASLVTSKLASLASEATKHFTQRMKILQNLVELWEKGTEAIIIKESLDEEMLSNEDSVHIEDSAPQDIILNKATQQTSGEQSMLVIEGSLKENEMLVNEETSKKIEMLVDEETSKKNEMLVDEESLKEKEMTVSNMTAREPLRLSSPNMPNLPVKINKLCLHNT